MTKIGTIVVNPVIWEAILIILGAVAACFLLYFVYIGITLRMARNRHRDPLGWVLLSLFVSPLLTWIILFIVGDKKS
jgi:uncharacterized membrane-anchored protein